MMWVCLFAGAHTCVSAPLQNSLRFYLCLPWLGVLLSFCLSSYLPPCLLFVSLCVSASVFLQALVWLSLFCLKVWLAACWSVFLTMWVATCVNVHLPGWLTTCLIVWLLSSIVAIYLRLHHSLCPPFLFTACLLSAYCLLTERDRQRQRVSDRQRGW